MNFEKDQNKYTVLMILGFVILIGGTIVARILGFEAIIGGLSGLGGAWIGISSMKLYQIRRKPELYEEHIIGQQDERSIAIRGYAGYASFMTTLLAISIMTLLFLHLDYTYPLAIAAGLLLIHIVSFFLYAGYYGKKL